MSKKRIIQINQLIKEELGTIILREIDFPKDMLATITRVITSEDLLHSKVYISVYPEAKFKEALKTLEKQIYFLQQKLNHRLKMKPIPKISFTAEKETSKAGRVEELLEELKKEKK